MVGKHGREERTPSQSSHLTVSYLEMDTEGGLRVILAGWELFLWLNSYSMFNFFHNLGVGILSLLSIIFTVPPNTASLLPAPSQIGTEIATSSTTTVTVTSSAPKVVEKVSAPISTPSQKVVTQTVTTTTNNATEPNTIPQPSPTKAYSVTQSPSQICSSRYLNATWDGTYSSDGNYNCTCQAGYELSSDSASCQVIRQQDTQQQSGYAPSGNTSCQTAQQNLSTFQQQNPYMMAAQSNPNIAGDVNSGRSALMAQTFYAQESVLQQAVQNACQ